MRFCRNCVSVWRLYHLFRRAYSDRSRRRRLYFLLFRRSGSVAKRCRRNCCIYGCSSWRITPGRSLLIGSSTEYLTNLGRRSDVNSSADWSFNCDAGCGDHHYTRAEHCYCHEHINPHHKLHGASNNDDNYHVNRYKYKYTAVGDCHFHRPPTHRDGTSKFHSQCLTAGTSLCDDNNHHHFDTSGHHEYLLEVHNSDLNRVLSYLHFPTTPAMGATSAFECWPWKNGPKGMDVIGKIDRSGTLLGGPKNMLREDLWRHVKAPPPAFSTHSQRPRFMRPLISPLPRSSSPAPIHARLRRLRPPQ